MSELRLFIPIGKVDEAKRTAYGTLTEECADKSGEIFDYASGKAAVQAWSDEIKAASKGKSLGNVRAMHGNIAAGKFTDIVYDDANKRIEGAAKIIDDDEWEKVVSGVYCGFSIGGAYTKRWQDPDNSSLWRFTPKLSEVSLVDNPCVPTATFEYIKADGSTEMRKFTPSHKEDSMDPKALAAAQEALAKGTATDEQKAAAQAEANTLLKAAQEADAKGEATDEQKALIAKAVADAEVIKAAAVKDGKPVKPKSAPVQKWEASDGKTFLNKRECELHELEVEKQAELAPGLAQMDALLKEAKKPAEEDDEDKEGDDEETKKAKSARREKKAKAEKDDAEMAAKKEKEAKEAADKAAADELGKKDYSDKEREAMAESGEALEDGSYPIKTKKDLENAIQAFGRAKDKDKAKAHIKARAKALGAEDMLPDEWSGKKKEKAAPTGKLEKGMYGVSELACVLERIEQLMNSSKFEAALEGDNSEMPKKLMEWLKAGIPILQAMVEEETSEMIDEEEDEVMEMAANWKGEACDAIAKHYRAKAEPLVKSDSKKESDLGTQLIKFAEALEKAGARHSKADAERVQALHDHAEDVHKCMGEMADKCMKMHKDAGEAKNTAIDLGAKGEPVEDEEDEPQGSGRGAAKMSKALAELSAKNDELLVVTKLATTQNETLLKAIPLIEGLQAQVKTLSDEKSEIAKRVEHLEGQPMPAKGHVRAVSKTQDGGTGDGNAEAEYKAKLAKMTPEQQAHELMKLTLSNPRPMHVSA